jgi:hypothetical protein
VARLGVRLVLPLGISRRSLYYQPKEPEDGVVGGSGFAEAAADGVRDVSSAAATVGVVPHAGGGGARVRAACANAGGGLNGYRNFD